MRRIARPAMSLCLIGLLSWPSGPQAITPGIGDQHHATSLHTTLSPSPLKGAKRSAPTGQVGATAASLLLITWLSVSNDAMLLPFLLGLGLVVPGLIPPPSIISNPTLPPSTPPYPRGSIAHDLEKLTKEVYGRTRYLVAATSPGSQRERLSACLSFLIYLPEQRMRFIQYIGGRNYDPANQSPSGDDHLINALEYFDKAVYSLQQEVGINNKFVAEFIKTAKIIDTLPRLARSFLSKNKGFNMTMLLERNEKIPSLGDWIPTHSEWVSLSQKESLNARENQFFLIKKIWPSEKNTFTPDEFCTLLIGATERLFWENALGNVDERFHGPFDAQMKRLLDLLAQNIKGGPAWEGFLDRLYGEFLRPLSGIWPASRNYRMALRRPQTGPQPWGPSLSSFSLTPRGAA